MKKRTKIIFVLSGVILIGGSFVLGAYFGYARRPFAERVVGVSNQQPPAGVNVDFDAFWKVWTLIDQKYPGAKDISAQDRVYGAIKGLMASLNDPYSVYFPPTESKDFQDTVNGSFEGIGLEVGIKNKALTVIAPLKDTPAYKAGLKPGDIVLKIDDASTSDMTVDQAVHLIRGKKGVAVKLSIFRSGEDQPRDISVVRDVIDIPTLDTEKKGDVFIIHLYNFGASAGIEMNKAVEEFIKSGDSKLIIDLRNDPGGYLDAVVNINSMFLPEGATIVRENFGNAAPEQVYRSKGFNLVDPSKVKIAILINKGSASASEIMAGALSEAGVAKLIGETSYGKGSVQEVFDVTNSTTMKLTIAKWLTPKGVWISKKGITPDIAVAEDTSKDADPKNDPVINRAIQYFNTGN